MLQDVIERTGDRAPATARASALAALGEMAMWTMLRSPIGIDVLGCLTDARAAAEEADDDLARLLVIDASVPVHLLCMDPLAATAATEEGLDLARAAGDRWWLARLTSWRAVALQLAGDPATAVALATDARLLAADIGDRIQMLRSTAVLLGLPEVDPALLPASEELLEVAHELGADLEEGTLRAILAVETADPAVAAGHLRVTLEVGRRTGLWFQEEFATAVAVLLAARVGDHPRAARLIGGMSSRWPAVQLQVAPRHREQYEAAVATTRAALGDEEFARIETRGSVEGWDRTLQCCRELLDELRGPGAPGNGGSDDDLTEREREVLDQMTKGLTNKEIADALGIRPRTVAHHTSAIFRKFGVRSRTEAVIRARDGL